MPTITTHARAIIAGLVLAAQLGAPVYAQDPKLDPARIAAAKELVATMGGVEQARASIQQFVNAMIADVSQRDEKIAKPAELFMRSETQPDKPRVKAFVADMEDAATKFYAERFTADEIKAIVAFQTSEAGKKFQKLTPELVAILVPRMTSFQEGLIRDMQKGISAGAAKEAPAAKDAGAAEKK